MKVLALKLLLLVLSVSPIVLLVWLAIFFSRTKRSSEKQEPRRDGLGLEFFPARRVRLLVGSVLVALAVFAILTLVGTVSQGGGWYAIFIPLSVMVAILLAKPRTVMLDHNGIRQQRWIRSDREIAWSEIAWMRRGRNTDTTYVKRRNGGRPISFSPLLVGQSRFEREVRAHMGNGDSAEDE